MRIAERLIVHLFIACSVLWLLSCGSSGTVIVVTVDGLTAEVEAIAITATLDGVQYKQPKSFQTGLSSFRTDLDPGVIGNFIFKIDALQSQCVLMSGQGQIQASGESRLDLMITVNRLPIKQCDLTIQKLGGGNVKSTPLGIDCGGTCTARFNYGQTIHLDALPDIPASPYQWSGRCSGNQGCDLTIDGPVTAGVDFTPRLCGPAGWCWDNPWPQGNWLSAVWVASDKTVFSAGYNGTIIRNNGVVWTSMKTNTTDSFYGIWGSSLTDIWAVGDYGAIMHYDGSQWLYSGAVTSQQLYAIWGNNANDVWAVGDNSTILHFDGTKWNIDNPTALGTPTLTGIWAASATDVWAVGFMGTVLHRVGGTWMPVSGLPNEEFHGIWGSRFDDIWIVGRSGTFHRWNGASWNDMGSAGNQINSIWGVGTNTIWATAGDSIWRWDGFTWMRNDRVTANRWIAVSGNASDFVYAVGQSGLISAWNGSQWSDITTQVSPNAGAIAGGWSAPNGDAWSVGNGTIFRWQGLQWAAVTSPTTAPLFAVWGSASDDVWAVGQGGAIIRWTGMDWRSVSSGSTADLVAVHGVGPNNVWAAGSDGTVLRWDGQGWMNVPKTAANLYSIFVDKSGTWVGSISGIYLWDGTSWNQKSTVHTRTFAATSDGLMFAAGLQTFQRWDGTNWVNANGPANISIIHGSFAVNANEAWFGGDFGQMYHLLNGTWTSINTETTNTINVMFGTGKDIWAGGASGTILHLRQ